MEVVTIVPTQANSEHFCDHHDTVPPELIELIINFAFKDKDIERKDIKNIRLCNSTCVDCVRRHPEFFERIKLLSPLHFKEFMEYINNFPNSDLPRSLRRLVIYTGNNSNHYESNESEDELLNQLMYPKHFPSMVELTLLRNDGSESRRIDIPLIGLGRCIVFGHLSKLVVSNSVVPHNVLIHAFHNVRELTLANTRCFRMNGAVHRSSPFKISKLERLVLTGIIDQCVIDLFLLEPQPSRRFPNFRVLSFVNYCEEHERFASAIRNRLTSTLESVEIIIVTVEGDCFDEAELLQRTTSIWERDDN